MPGQAPAPALPTSTEPGGLDDQSPFQAAAAESLTSQGDGPEKPSSQSHGQGQKQQAAGGARRSKLFCACCGGGGGGGDEAADKPGPLTPKVSKQQSLLASLFSRPQASTPPTRASKSGNHGLVTQYTDVQWFDALSHAAPSQDLAQRLAQVESAHLVAMASLPRSVQQQQQEPSAVPPWVPNPPLLFAEPGLQWVPVTPVTGFAAIWDMDPERTTPFPQPIDVMMRANFITRRVHASIHWMNFQEDDARLTVATQPSFVPPGIPSAYMEVYDKTLGSSTDRPMPSWTPRRDLMLGSCYGRIYMTTTGMLVLRGESRPPFSTKVQYITEDYLLLQEDGDVIVDRMCCQCVASGKTATQFYVGRRRK